MVNGQKVVREKNSKYVGTLSNASSHYLGLDEFSSQECRVSYLILFFRMSGKKLEMQIVYLKDRTVLSFKRWICPLSIYFLEPRAYSVNLKWANLLQSPLLNISSQCLQRLLD